MPALCPRRAQPAHLLRALDLTFALRVLFLPQYTRYPPIDSRNNKVVADYACMSADNSTYTNPKYPTLIVAGAPGDIEVNPDHCSVSALIPTRL